jgi:hypothetical protein
VVVLAQPQLKPTRLEPTLEPRTMATTCCVDSLPVELLTGVFSLLELHQLLTVAQTCRLWRAVCSDPLLNPFRDPIAHILEDQCQLESEKTGGMRYLRTLSAFQWIPNRNWVEILVMASPHFILFEWNVPNISEEQWEEAFRLRFPPSWTKWRRDRRWRAAFLKSIRLSIFNNVTDHIAQNADAYMASIKCHLHK